MNGDEDLRFRREPDNEYDSNAVAIDALISGGTVEDEWMPIGYIARDKNSDLAAVLDNGKKATIKISEITGKEEGKNYGVNVYIEIEKPRKRIRSKDAVLMKDIFGNEIFYDDVTHEYTNALGELYISGSKYASQFEKPFDKAIISNAIARKNGLSSENAQEICDMWSLKASASAHFGTSIHEALELYGRFKQLAEKIGKDTHLHDNSVLGRAVKSFYDEHPDVNNVRYEALVVDHEKKRAGRIDRIEVEKDGVWITDFKTNSNIQKSLDKYWLQLSFYAAVLKANNLRVKGLKIYHYTGEKWDTIVGKVIDIDKDNNE